MTHTEALKRIRVILSAVTGFDDDDDEYIGDARRAVDQLIDMLNSQPQQETKEYVAGFNDGLTGASELRTLGEKIAQPSEFALKHRIAVLEGAVIGLETQRTWVGLTDAERLFLHGHDSELDDLISVIEAKLKEKNDRP